MKVKQKVIRSDTSEVLFTVIGDADFLPQNTSINVSYAATDNIAPSSFCRSPDVPFGLELKVTYEMEDDAPINMNVRQINAALKKVVVPDLSPSNREAYTAGVRALAYELEKQGQETLPPVWVHPGDLAAVNNVIKYHACAFSVSLGGNSDDMGDLFDHYWEQSNDKS